MESDKDRIERLEKAYRDLWNEHEDLKNRIKQNYQEFKVLRDQFGVKPLDQPKPVQDEVVVKHEIPTIARPAEVKPVQQVKPAKTNSEWEKFIGEQLLSKIGLLVLLIGLVIGTKYAIDHNWLSVGLRILGSYAIAGVLGFFAYRFRTKYPSFSAVLASGAVSVSYFITYAAFSWYHVIPFGVSFAGLLICVAAAVYLAWYYNLVIIAHFGLIAAYVMPPLISTANNHLSYYLAYMLVINIGMLAISLLKNWKSIRVPVLIWSNLIFVFWFFTSYHEKEDWLVATVYALLFFLSFHVSAILPSFRRKEQLPVASFGEILPVSLTSYAILRYIFEAADVSTFVSVSITVLLFAYFGYWIYLAIQKKDEVLRDIHALLIAAFLVITIAIDVNWMVQPIYFNILPALFFVVMVRYNAKQYDALITVGWILALVHFSVLQLFESHYSADTGKMRLTAAVVIAIQLALCAFFYRNKEQRELKSAAVSLLPFSTFVALFLPVSMEILRHYWGLAQRELDSDYIILPHTMTSETAYAVILGWFAMLLLIFTSIRTFMLKEKPNSAFVVLVSILSGGLLLFYSALSYQAIGGYLKDDYFFGSYALGRYMGFIGLIGATYLVSNKAGEQKNALAIFSLVLLWVLSLELTQWSILSGFGAGYKILLTLLWVAFSIGMIYRGLTHNSALLRITAMAILGISMVKLFFFDLTRLSTITKVVVFMLIGGLLLVGAYFYQRLAKAEQNKEEE